jgi:hypothetical protein
MSATTVRRQARWLLAAAPAAAAFTAYRSAGPAIAGTAAALVASGVLAAALAWSPPSREGRQIEGVDITAQPCQEPPRSAVLAAVGQGRETEWRS